MNEDKVFKEKNILKAIFKLAIPTIIGQIILVVYNMSDTFFIGLTGSDVYMSAVTVCSPAFMILSAISNLFGVGGASLIARCLGKKQKEKTYYVSSFSILFCIIITIIYSLIVLIFSKPIINALGGRNVNVHYYSYIYLLITVVFGGVFTSLNMLFAHLNRAEGKSLDAAIGVVLGGILNIVLDPLFMFVILDKGNEIMGAAIATCLSNLIALIYYILINIIKYKNNTCIKLKLSLLIFEDDIPGDVIKVGLPAFIMTSFENISYGVLDNLMANHGIEFQAALGVAKKINMLAHCMVRGLTQGVLPLIAYNYSANDIKRMNKTTNTMVFIAIAIGTACMMGCIIFASNIVSVFVHGNNKTAILAIKFLKILCLGAPFSACAYSFISFFQAVAEGRKAFLLAILRKGIVDIPMMLILNRFINIYGEVMATPITDVLCCVVSIIIFKITIDTIKKNENIINA